MSPLAPSQGSCEAWVSLYPGSSERFIGGGRVGPGLFLGETLASTDFPPLFWIPGIMAETFPFLLLFVEANS